MGPLPIWSEKSSTPIWGLISCNTWWTRRATAQWRDSGWQPQTFWIPHSSGSSTVITQRNQHLDPGDGPEGENREVFLEGGICNTFGYEQFPPPPEGTVTWVLTSLPVYSFISDVLPGLCCQYYSALQSRLFMLPMLYVSNPFACFHTSNYPLWIVYCIPFVNKSLQYGFWPFSCYGVLTVCESKIIDFFAPSYIHLSFESL